jgi:hypothetical protein
MSNYIFKVLWRLQSSSLVAWILLLGMLAYPIWYVATTTSLVPYQDFISMKEMIATMAEGELSFASYFYVHNGVFKAPLGMLLLDLDIRLLGFDQRAEVIFYLLFKVGVAALLLRAATTGVRGLKLYAMLCFAPLFSLNQWENLVLCQGAHVFAVLFGIVWFFRELDLILFYGAKKRRCLIFGLAWLFMFVVGSSSYIVAAGGAMIFYTLRYARISFIRAGFLLVAIALGVAVYLFLPPISTGSALSKPLSLFHLLEFFVFACGGQYVHGEFQWPVEAFRWIGIVAILVQSLILISTGKRRDIFSRCIVFLILLSFANCALIALGRYDYGPQYGLSSRYTSITNVGAIAVALFIMHLLLGRLRPRPSRFSRIGLGGMAAAGLIIFSMALKTANNRELEIKPYRAGVYQVMRDGVLNHRRDNEFYPMFQARKPADVPAFLAILEKYNLSVFRNKP